MRAELYKIDFPNGKSYIGISKDAKNRFSRHLALARRGSKLPVHAAMRKFEGDVDFSIMVVGTREYILDLEVKAISAYGTREKDKGYNLSVGGDNGTLGMKISEETKELWKKVRIPHNKGLPLPEEQKKKLSIANLGRKHSPETRAKMSFSQRGRTISEEHRRNLSLAQTGMKYSDEARAKMSASAKARHERERQR